MSELKSLLNSLLEEIYTHYPPKRVQKQYTKMHPVLYEKRLLQKLSPQVLKDICEILQFEIHLISQYLERVLISRDKNRTHRTILCGFLDILVSSKFGESSREMRFGVASPPGSAVQKGRGDAATPTGRPTIIADDTNSSSDFNQWLHAMKMVARLPGGMPPEFRRKLWLALADKYLKSKDVDWEKEEVKCFSEQWREDDEELGIQIVKDLHRTGSSLCSGPAGTINQAKLKRILLGYARFNPEVGYCQGFNMLGALILQVMDKEETESIKVMIYLVEGILPSGYFSGSLGGLQADMAVFRELMTSKLPRLAKHLQKLQGPVENAFEPPLTNVFTMQWFLTMFCTCLPMTCVLRVWDLVLIEGSDVLLRTALVLWSLLEERILSARTADDFYCQMGSFSSELLNGHLVDSNGLIEKVVDLGPIPDLQKLRDKHLYNITPFRDKKGLQLYYSDEDGDSDEESKMAVATAWGLRLRRGSAGLASKSSDGKDRIALDISLLKKQYDRLRERQRQAHIILTSAVARQGSSPNQASIQMNQLLMGRNAIVTNNGRRIGPPQGAIPPARKPSLPNSKPPKLAQTKKLLSGETLHWRDTDLSKRRRGSLKWKDIKSDSSQSGMEDRPAALVESAPSSRSSSSEAKSKRPSYKATRQRSDSSSYSEESDGNSSTSTSLCDEDDMPEHNNLSSLEGSPMRKSKSSKKHSEVTKQKSLEDVLNSNDGQPTVDNQIPFIQLTTIESPVLNANKTEIEPSLVENSETESNRLDYAGFVDEFSWPDINEQPTTSVSLEDTTTEAISEGDFLSLSNVITSTSQLSPMPDIATYINNSNISPLRTPISGFDYANLVVNIDSDPKKFDVNEEGVINEYFERVNVVERPTKLDLLYSLNEEESIRNAYVSCEPTPESPKGVKEKPKIVEEESTQQRQASEEELDRKMKVLLEYSNKSSLSFIAEAKQEFSTGMFKEVEFDVDSLKYQPSKLVPIKRAHAVESPEMAEKGPEMEPSLNVKNLAEELMEIELQTKAKEITQKEEVREIKETTVSNIPSTEDLETRFRALEMNFSGRKESLKNEALVRKNSQRSIERDVDESSKRSSFVDSPSKHYLPQVKTSESLTKVNEGSGEADQRFRNSVGEDIEGFSKRSSFVDSSPKHYSPQVETSECLTKVNEESGEADKSRSNSVGDVDDFSKRSSCVGSPSTHYSPQVETSENLSKVNEKSGEAVERPRYSVGDIDGFSKRSSFVDSPSKHYSPQVETLGSLTKVNEGSGGADQSCRNSVGDIDGFSKRSSFADSPSKHYSPQVETSDCLTKVNEESGEAVQRSRNSVGELEDSHFKDLSAKRESLEYQTKDIEVLSEEIDTSTKEEIVELTELSNTFTRKESTSLKRTIEEKHSPMTTETNVREKDLSTDLKDREEEQIEDEHDTHALQTHRYSIENRYQCSNIEHEKPLSPAMTEIPKSNLNEDLKYDSHHYLKSEDENLMDKVETGNKQSEEIHGSASSQIESLKTEIRESDLPPESAGSADENLSLEQDFMKTDTEEERAILNDKNEKSHEKSSPLDLQRQYEEVAKDPRKDRDINSSSCAAVEERKSISQDAKEPEFNDLEKEASQQEEPLTIMKQVEEPSGSSRKSITDNPEAATLSETKSEQETDQVKTTNEKKVALDEPPVEPKVPCVASPTDIPDSQFQSIIDETDTINLSDDRKQLLLPKDTRSKTKEILDEGVLFYEHHPAVPDGVEAGGVNDPNQSENASTQPNETQSREAESSQPQEKTPTSEDQLQPEKSIVPASSNRPDNTIVRKHDEPEPSFPTPKTIDKPQSTYSFSYTQNHFNDDVSVLSEVQGLQPNQTANAIQSTFNLQHSPENLFAVTTSVSLRNSQTIRSSVSVKSSVSLKSSALYDRERSLQVNTGITVCDDPNEDSSKMISSNQLQLSGNQERSNDGAGITVSVINSEPSARTSNISLSMRLPEHSGDSLVGKTSRTDMLAQPNVLPQILDKNSSEKDKTVSDGNKADVRSVDEPKTRKSSYSQEVEERLKALERRLSERVLTVSKDTKGADQPVAKEEPRQEQVLTLDDVQPMKLNVEKVSPTDSKQQKETKPGTGPEVEAMTDKEETNKVVPSTAELEHRFHELERKLSAKNIHLPAKIEQPQQEDKASSTTNPSIVLTKNEGSHGERELNDSKEQKKNEELPSTPRRRIPSTEDLENRFEALEIQKSLKSPGNLLSPSKIKEEFPPEGAIDQETKRKAEIPSTEDLESRFQALEQSKKGDDVLKKSQSQENTTKPKDVPKVTFAETSDTKKITHEEKPDLFQEVSESPTSTSRTELSRERVLRKVPSAKDLEARFEALEKRKSFTGFSSKTQEHLLAEQSRNYLSSESLNTVESLKRRELCEKKVASTEDLVLRLDALEQRMAITENSIKNKISLEKELPQKTANFECRFEALDNRQSFRENIATNKTPSTSRENLQNTFKPTKETLPETKLSMIKRSLFEPEPEPKWLPSTQDLENRFDALERQKSKSSLGVKANVTREPIKTEIWDTPFEQIEHRTPSPFGTKPLPRWDNDTTLSRFPSTRNLESRFEALEQQKFSTERRSNLTSTGFEVSKPSIQKTTLEKPAKAHASRSIDLVLEQISTKTEEIEREHQMLSKVPSTQDLEIRYNDLQLQTKRGDDDCDQKNEQNLEQSTDSIELTGNQKRRDLYKLESQSDETLTISHPTGTEFDTKSESRPTSCPEYRDPFDSNIVTTDRVLKIIEENSKILHRILKKTLADSGGSRGDFNSTESRSGFTDSLLALGNIFPRTDESISPSRIRPQSPRVRSTITFRSDDNSITDRLASIKSTIKSIDTLCEDQSSRKDKCQRYIDSLFTSSPRSSNATSPIPIPTSHHLVASRPIIRIDDFEDGRRSPNPPAHYQERVAMREMKKEVSPRRRRDEEREEYESRVRRDTMMPNSVDDEAPSEISCSLENIANNKVDSEVDRINHKDKTQLERSISPYYAPGSDLHNRSTTPVVYVPTKLEIRHTTVTSTFYDRFLTEKHIERTFPRSKKHSPAVSPTITKSQLDISSSSGSTSLDRSSKSAENSPSRRKDSNSSGGALSPNPTTTVSTAVAYKRGFLSSLEVAQKDLHIRSCDNILLQLRSSTLSNQQPMMPSITSMGYNPLPIPTKSPDLGISLGLYKDIHNGNDATSSKS